MSRSVINASYASRSTRADDIESFVHGAMRSLLTVEWTKRRSLGAFWEVKGSYIRRPSPFSARVGERSALSAVWSSSISRFHFWRPRPTAVRPLSFPPCVCASGAFARWQRARAQRDRAIRARARSIRATLIIPGCNLRKNTRIRENRITAAIGPPNCTFIARMSRDSRPQISARCPNRSRVLMSLRYSREPYATFRRRCTCSVLFIFPRVRYSSSSKRMTVTNESKFRKMNFSRGH